MPTIARFAPGPAAGLIAAFLLLLAGAARL
jgi:hypothetical protein